MNNQRFKIVSGDGVVLEKNLEDYIVRGLIDKDDINYDEHAELLYKLAGQMVRHLQSYLQKPEDVLSPAVLSNAAGDLDPRSDKPALR